MLPGVSEAEVGLDGEAAGAIQLVERGRAKVNLQPTHLLVCWKEGTAADRSSWSDSTLRS